MSKESKNENPGSGEEKTEYLHAASEINALRAMLNMKKNDECNSEKMRRKNNAEEE